MSAKQVVEVVDRVVEPVLEASTSKDGTRVAYWRSGRGQPLVLVHGTAADHSRWNTIRSLLDPSVTVCAVDRRGRGASGDGDDYALEREYDDIAAVIDAVAHRCDGPVDVLGHSYGALCALGAASRTANLRRLALYEPPVRPNGAYPTGFAERLGALLAEGRRDEVVAAFFRQVVRITDAQLTAMRAVPVWQARLAVAHTLPREQRATEAFAFEPAAYRTWAWPTLLLAGSESPDFLRRSTAALANALPSASVVEFEGHQHTAMDTAPQQFADSVLSFLTGC